MSQINADNFQVIYRSGLAYGSEAFLDHPKTRFSGDCKNEELPRHNRLLQDPDPQELADRAAHAFGLDLQTLRNMRRISPDDMDKRDMLIYYLWETGKLSNQKIGLLLSLTYSNISRRVSLIKKRFSTDSELIDVYIACKSQIKV